MEQSTEEDAQVMAEILGDWQREENVDLNTLIPGNSEQRQQNMQSQAPTSSHNSVAYSNQMQHHMAVPTKVPTFSSANRPSVLDLSTTVRYQDQRGQINGQCQRVASPHSPHQQTSPYAPAGQVFSYNNNRSDQPPHSPHAREGAASPHHINQAPMSPHNMNGPVSPHSPYNNRNVSPVSPHPMSSQSGSMSPHRVMSPHQAGPMSPHHPSPMSPHNPGMSPHHAGPVSPHHGAPMSPHHPAMSPHHPGMSSHNGAPLSPHNGRPISPHMGGHSGSVSPVSRHHSPAPGASSVFGRYAGASPVSMHSGNSSDGDSYYSSMSLKRPGGIDKDSHVYKAKRERNNVAVRKSREKKKQREAETERRVKELSEVNTELQNKLDTVVKEMNLLKNLYKSIGISLPPEARDKLEKELKRFNK